MLSLQGENENKVLHDLKFCTLEIDEHKDLNYGTIYNVEMLIDNHQSDSFMVVLDDILLLFSFSCVVNIFLLLTLV